MRSRRPSAAHQEAVAARLARLSEEIAAGRAADLGQTRVRTDPVVEEGPAVVEEGPAVVEEGRSPVSRPGPLVEEGRSPVSRPPHPPTPVHRPGRHASRRTTERASLLAPLQGKVALTGPHVVVVLVLVVVALLLACWWLVRTTPTAISTTPVAQVSASPVEPDLVETQPSSDPTGAAGDTASAAGAVPEVTVDVAGKVRDPGIVVLPAGSRVIDALEAAGGARSSVDLSVLNLARPLVDGEQVLVGAPAAVTAPGAPAGVPGGAATPLVDLNTADQALLETLPGVGPVTAAAILAWRTEHGRFTVVEELLEVDGIGPATLEDLAPLVQVHP